MIRMRVCLYVLTGLFFCLSACKKLELQDDHSLPYNGTQILAHKGGPTWPYGNFQGNTLCTSSYGFEHADGVEVDLQMSRDGTIWLFHDEFFDDCDINGLGRIPGYTDDELRQHIACKGDGYTLTTLEDLFAYHHDHGLTKYIELDVKPWLPTKYSNTKPYLKNLADEIMRLAHKYDVSPYIGVECENAVFLNHIQQHSDIQTFLTTYGDFSDGCRKAIKAGYTGLSYSYSQKKIDAYDISLMHQKGLRIHVWTLDNDESVQEAINAQADFIQTNHL